MDSMGNITQNMIQSNKVDLNDAIDEKFDAIFARRKAINEIEEKLRVETDILLRLASGEPKKI